MRQMHSRCNATALPLLLVLLGVVLMPLPVVAQALSKGELKAYKKAKQIKKLQKKGNGRYLLNLVYIKGGGRKEAWKKYFASGTVVDYHEAARVTKRQFRKAYAKHKCAHASPYRAPFFGQDVPGTGRSPGCTVCAERGSIQERENEVWQSLWGRVSEEYKEPEHPLLDLVGVVELKLGNTLKFTPVAAGTAKALFFVQPPSEVDNFGGLEGVEKRTIGLWTRVEIVVTVLDPTGKSVPKTKIPAGSAQLRAGERLVRPNEDLYEALLEGLRQNVPTAELITLIEITDHDLPQDTFFTKYKDIDSRWLVGLLRKTSGEKVTYHRVLCREKSADSFSFIVAVQ